MIERPDVPAHRLIVAGLRNASDEGNARACKTARRPIGRRGWYRDQRIKLGIEPILTNTKAKLPFVGQVDLIGCVEAVEIADEMVLVAGVLGITLKNQCIRRQFGWCWREDVGDVRQVGRDFVWVLAHRCRKVIVLRAL